MSHSPPYGQGDEPPAKGKSTAGHGGSRVLLERVLTTQPLLHVFGHFHAGWGVSHHDAARTVFVNGESASQRVGESASRCRARAAAHCAAL